MVLFMELTLEMAIEAFADWRKNKKSKAEAIPELLTKMVKDLHPIYGTTKLRQSLGVNRNQLKSLSIIDIKKNYLSLNKKIWNFSDAKLTWRFFNWFWNIILPNSLFDMNSFRGVLSCAKIIYVNLKTFLIENNWDDTIRTIAIHDRSQKPRKNV